MCGIIGIVGERDVTARLLDGLRRMEYRGYDSAGIATVNAHGTLDRRRAVGKLVNLSDLLVHNPLPGLSGIGHTRWATHGAPTEPNAHPHATEKVAVVHNGIIENFLELRQELEAEGRRFASETDSEVVVHLVEAYMAGGADLETAVRQALPHVKGANAFVFLSSREPDRIVADRTGNAGGITVVVGDGEMFIASDIPATLAHTRDMIFV